MSTNRGIFENVPNKAPASPFTAVGSPFSAVPEPRKAESPFEIPDADEGFGFEAPPSPFSAVPSEPANTNSPFAIVPEAPARTAAAAPATTTPAWPSQAAAVPAPAPAFTAAAAPPPQRPAPAATTPAPAARQPIAPSAPRDAESDPASFSLHQLALRAIFGVDRELSSEEMMQRARSLPGIRHIARVGHQDLATVDAINQLAANLGFGSGGVKLHTGSGPIEFIREAGVLLAVQTDGGFAPGIRETLMIVARELGRPA